MKRCRFDQLHMRSQEDEGVRMSDRLLYEGTRGGRKRSENSMWWFSSDIDLLTLPTLCIMQAEMGGFVVDNDDDDDEGDGDDDDDDGSGDDGDRKKKKKKREKRKKESEDEDDELDDDDLDLMEENLGVRLNRQKKLKRVKKVRAHEHRLFWLRRTDCMF